MNAYLTCYKYQWWADAAMKLAAPDMCKWQATHGRQLPAWKASNIWHHSQQLADYCFQIQVATCSYYCKES